MKRFIKINYHDNYSCIYDSEKEVIEGCGYDVEEITFDELLEQVKGEYEIIEIEGEVKWLND